MPRLRPMGLYIGMTGIVHNSFAVDKLEICVRLYIDIV